MFAATAFPGAPATTTSPTGNRRINAADGLTNPEHLVAAITYVVRVLSDLHLGAPKGASGVGPNEFNELVNFIKSPLFNPRILVLNGDIYEQWASKWNEPSPSPDRYFNADRHLSADDYKTTQQYRFHQALTIAHNNRANSKFPLDIVYIPGNHDGLMTEALAKKYLPDFVIYGDYYELHGLHIEHGHVWDAFNYSPGHSHATISLNNGDVCAAVPKISRMLPLGYFICRAACQGEYDDSAEHKDWQRDFQLSVANNSAAAASWLSSLSPKIAHLLLTKNAFSDLVVNFPAKIHKVLNGVLIKQGGYEKFCKVKWLGSGALADRQEDFTLPEVIEIYGKMLSDMNKSIEKGGEGVSSAQVFWMLQVASSHNYDSWLNHWESSQKIRVLVFGHTHEPLAQFCRSREMVYANTGTWVEPQKRNWTDITLQHDKNTGYPTPVNVTVYSYDNGITASQHLPLSGAVPIVPAPTFNVMKAIETTSDLATGETALVVEEYATVTHPSLYESLHVAPKKLDDPFRGLEQPPPELDCIPEPLPFIPPVNENSNEKNLKEAVKSPVSKDEHGVI